jgi:hypothetical protein
MRVMVMLTIRKHTLNDINNHKNNSHKSNETNQTIIIERFLPIVETEIVRCCKYENKPCNNQGEDKARPPRDRERSEHKEKNDEDKKPQKKGKLVPHSEINFLFLQEKKKSFRKNEIDNFSKKNKKKRCL